MEKTMILYTSEEAASYEINICGWVSRGGRFFGEDERLARWDGCTHVECDGCGEARTKNGDCRPCHDKMMDEGYTKRERRVWDERCLLYSEVADRYFNDRDDLIDYCDDKGCLPEGLRLVICDQVYAKEIDPNDYYCDDLPDDGEVTGDLLAAFDKLNQFIRENKVVLSWIPGKYAAVL